MIIRPIIELIMCFRECMLHKAYLKRNTIEWSRCYGKALQLFFGGGASVSMKTNRDQEAWGNAIPRAQNFPLLAIYYRSATRTKFKSKTDSTPDREIPIAASIIPTFFLYALAQVRDRLCMPSSRSGAEMFSRAPSTGSMRSIVNWRWSGSSAS